METKNQTEIYNGMTVEEMKSQFFKLGSLVEPPYKVWQLNSKNHRYYYKFDDNGKPVFYPSVTTILAQTMPTSPYLIEWIASKGVEQADRYKMERAAYGTFMHGQFEELLINRTYDLDKLNERLKLYIESEKLTDDFIFYADDLKKDILAFAQFVRDYDVKPLAVEVALVHPEECYAGMIDLVCMMKPTINSKERITAIVDFKSGRKGFHEDNEIQLHLYKDMWTKNFPEYPIERVYNFSPKDWRKAPSYNLKDQTDSKNAAKIPALLVLAAIEDNKIDNNFVSVGGTVSLDSDPNECITTLSLSDIILKRKKEEKKPDESENIAEIGKEASNSPNFGLSNEKGINIPNEKENAADAKFEENNYTDLLNEEIDL